MVTTSFPVVKLHMCSLDQFLDNSCDQPIYSSRSNCSDDQPSVPVAVRAQALRGIGSRGQGVGGRPNSGRETGLTIGRTPIQVLRQAETLQLVNSYSCKTLLDDLIKIGPL